jgi:thiol:disulfide interchange protein DsbD
MVILTFYVAGLLLSFTPCVLPMIPILSGILAGEGEQITPKRGFILSSSYVLGMAIVYTMAGIISASIGLQLQAFFNAPWVIIIFVAIFIWLALAMFDLVNMELPSIFQNRLSKLNDQQKSGTIIGSFFIGAISSLIVTACVAPPLVATLMVIGQTGDVLRGGVALLAMSFGMGTPLIVIGTSAGKLLPKAGEWMNKVKHIFGFLMLGLAIYMLSRILDATFILALWGILALLMGVFFGGLNVIDKNSKNSEKGAKGIGLLAIIYGAALILGSLSGNTNPLQPLANIGIMNGQKTIASELHFKRIKSLDNLNSELAQAKLQNKSVMLDFYADWCVSCKEMEAYTFTDERVQNSLANTILLQADVTANDEIDQALLNELNVFGPPTIIFYNKDGIKKNGYEVVGYMKAKEFAQHTQSALNTNPII